MKILLDTCVSWKAKLPLQEAGHDVEWVGDWDSDPGDETILRRAHNEGRVLVTLDSDFGELAVRLKIAHRGIVRLVAIADDQHAAICQEVFRSHLKKLADGCLLTVDAYRVRVRPPETSE